MTVYTIVNRCFESKVGEGATGRPAKVDKCSTGRKSMKDGKPGPADTYWKERTSAKDDTLALGDTLAAGGTIATAHTPGRKPDAEVERKNAWAAGTSAPTDHFPMPASGQEREM